MFKYLVMIAIILFLFLKVQNGCNNFSLLPNFSEMREKRKEKWKEWKENRPFFNRKKDRNTPNPDDQSNDEIGPIPPTPIQDDSEQRRFKFFKRKRKR